MNKWFVIAAVAGVLVIALAGVSSVYAQEELPPTPAAPGYGPGWMNGCRADSTACADSPVHELMQAALAEQFGLSVEELNSLHEQGQTLWQVAQEKGLSFEEFRSRMLTARQQAFDQAVEQGLLPADQPLMRGRMGMNRPSQAAGAACPYWDENSGGPGGFRWNQSQ